MKKYLFILLFVLAGTCFAHFPVYVNTEDGNGAFSASWSPIQLGIFPHEHLQIFRENTNVYGFSMGLLALNQESSVFSFAPMNGIKKNYFLQTGLLTGNSCNYGISVAAINMVGRNYSFFLTDVCRHGFINFLKRSLKRVILKNGFYVQSSLIHEIA